MSTAGVSGLLVISMIAVAAPVLAAGVQRARVPDVVIEIVAGIVVGPSVLGWVKIDQPVGLVALLGLAFLLFLAGLEVDLKVITPSRLRAPLAGYAASLLLGSAAGFAFHAAGWVRSPLFLAITLSSSSLGLVVPVLADALQSRTLLGQLIIAGATIGEFGAITLLSLFFSATRAGTASNAITFGIFGVAATAVGLTLSRADRSLRLDAFLTRLQDTTAEIRVRIAVALLVGFVALAAKIGLQIILGAFLAGVILNIVDRDTASHPLFRTKLDALGYGFLISVFFVSSGVEFDLTALTHSLSALAKIPLFLLAVGHGRMSTATRQDYATAAAAALLSDEAGNRTYELGGPAYDVTGLAQLITGVTGTKVTYRDLSADEYAAELQRSGMDETTAHFVAALDVAVARGDLEISSTDLADLLGRPATGPADVVHAAYNLVKVTSRTAVIGLIGAGRIGGTLAGLAVDAGYHVVLSNGRGPATLSDLAARLGPSARAATPTEAAGAAGCNIV